MYFAKSSRAKLTLSILLSVVLVTTIGLVLGFPTNSMLNDFSLKEEINQKSLSEQNINNLLINESSKIEYLGNFSLQLEELKRNDLGLLVSEIAKKESAQLNSYHKVQVTATGYTAGIESTGKTIEHPQYGMTYSGVQVRRDLYSTVAADLGLFPLGTVLYIPNYGYGVVSDKGSAIVGNMIDLYFDSVDEVYEQWGKKSVTVYVIEYGKGRVTETLLNEYNDAGRDKIFM